MTLEFLQGTTTVSEASLFFWLGLLALGIVAACDARKRRKAKRRYR